MSDKLLLLEMTGRYDQGIEYGKQIVDERREPVHNDPRYQRLLRLANFSQ